MRRGPRPGYERRLQLLSIPDNVEVSNSDDPLPPSFDVSKGQDPLCVLLEYIVEVSISLGHHPCSPL
jgi:hypothetical protein